MYIYFKVCLCMYIKKQLYLYACDPWVYSYKFMFTRIFLYMYITRFFRHCEAKKLIALASVALTARRTDKNKGNFPLNIQPLRVKSPLTPRSNPPLEIYSPRVNSPLRNIYPPRGSPRGNSPLGKITPTKGNFTGNMPAPPSPSINRIVQVLILMMMFT
jgi:type II secretory pathway pseudopilin PulG